MSILSNPEFFCSKLIYYAGLVNPFSHEIVPPAGVMIRAVEMAVHMNSSETKKPKKTRPWVIWADRLADRVITVGGILVIAAVLGMLVFLVFQVIPLFKGGSLESHQSYKLNWKPYGPFGLYMDEYRTIVASVSTKGVLNSWHAASGRQLLGKQLSLDDKDITAFAMSFDGSNFVYGFSDGTVRSGTMVVSMEILGQDSLPANLENFKQWEA